MCLCSSWREEEADKESKGRRFLKTIRVSVYSRVGPSLGSIAYSRETAASSRASSHCSVAVLVLVSLLLLLIQPPSSVSAATMPGAPAAEPHPVLLALPGPAFPHIDFDPLPAAAAEGEGGCAAAATGMRGTRFMVGGRPLLLNKSVGVDSESHTEKTAGSVWDCSLVLAKYLESNREALLEGKHVVELGSGQGVVGLACALAGAQAVTMTDVDAALPGLEANVAINGLEGRARTMVLDWMQAEKHTKALGEIDTVIAADTVWVEDLARPFVRALSLSLATKAGARGVLCHRTRSHRTDSVLFEEMFSAGIEVSEVARSEHDGTFRDPDIRIYRLSLKQS